MSTKFLIHLVVTVGLAPLWIYALMGIAALAFAKDEPPIAISGDWGYVIAGWSSLHSSLNLSRSFAPYILIAASTVTLYFGASLLFVTDSRAAEVSNPGTMAEHLSRLLKREYSSLHVSSDSSSRVVYFANTDAVNRLRIMIEAHPDDTIAGEFAHGWKDLSPTRISRRPVALLSHPTTIRVYIEYNVPNNLDFLVEMISNVYRDVEGIEESGGLDFHPTS